jgi:hypothetical protein
MCYSVSVCCYLAALRLQRMPIVVMCYLVSVVLKDCTDVTDGYEPRKREIFSSALLMFGGKVL